MEVQIIDVGTFYLKSFAICEMRILRTRERQQESLANAKVSARQSW